VRVPLDSTYLFERRADGRYLGPPGIAAPGSGAPEVSLQPYDNVLVFQQPDWEIARTVALTGEVRFPGRYTLKSKDERLGDLIQRAGGLTSEGYAAGIVFARREGDLGRVGLDLPGVLKDRRHRDNLVLMDGDSIHIPQYAAVVNVRGAVNSPVAVAYVPGRSLDYYIAAAGGASRRGDRKQAYVTQPNGKVESRRGRGILPDAVPKPAAGSLVYVPEKDPNDKRDFVAAATSVTQVLASIIGIVALLRR
jgi:protein involved in polysaccharide export with SLBB domain